MKRKKSPGTKVLQNIIMKKLSFSLTPFKTTFSRLNKSSLQACDHQREEIFRIVNDHVRRPNQIKLCKFNLD